MFLQTVASTISNEAFVLGMSAVGAGIAVCSGIGTGIGQGNAAGQAAAAVGRGGNELLSACHPASYSACVLQ